MRRSWFLLPWFACLLLVVAMCGPFVYAQNLVRFDATAAVPEPKAVDGISTAITSPNDETISLNSQYLLRDGRPWLPVMGEMHFSRVPEPQWEDEILKMKAAGVEIVSAYIIWIHHEEVKGQFDWTGQRNLRHFAELCAKHHMYLYLRVGPWAHGEVRNGGFPDWLLQEVKNVRTNDPAYLGYVSTYLGQIGEQVRGMMWKDGGPVIGVQLENEYGRRGPNAGEAHILELKKLVIGSGMETPLYSVTGWDRAVVPDQAVVGMFGGYPDAPWDKSLKPLPPQEVYAFRFGSRVSANMGAIGASGATVSEPAAYRYPFMTTEMGGGIEDTYHRRPVISADDVAAMMPVMLGSGANLYGTYMFHGGENPEGRLSTLEESQATGYANDLPVKSYDFQAPLSEFGEERDSFRELKVFNYFLNDFGGMLAPMTPVEPSVLPKNPADVSVPRVAVRHGDAGGFVFFNNYVRDYTMPDRRGFQVEVRLRDKVLRVPEEPTLLPSAVYGIWPFDLELDGLRLEYATAQLFTRVKDRHATTIFFVALPGIPVEFALRDVPGLEVDPSVKVTRHGGLVVLHGVESSARPILIAKDGRGRRTQIILLRQSDAEEAWKVVVPSGNALLTTGSGFFADGDRITLENVGDAKFRSQVWPASAGSVVPGPSAKAGAVHVKVTAIRPAGVAEPVKIGKTPAGRPNVAMAPGDEEFAAKAARWKIELDPAEVKTGGEVFLDVRYDGDVARLTSGGRLLVDNFYNGEVWRVGLGRFREQIGRDGLQLEIMPRRADAPVFLEPKLEASKFVAGQVCTLGGVVASVVHRMRLVVR